jgi:hypothetical protein
LALAARPEARIPAQDGASRWYFQLGVISRWQEQQEEAA